MKNNASSLSFKIEVDLCLALKIFKGGVYVGSSLYACGTTWSERRTTFSGASIPVFCSTS